MKMTYPICAVILAAGCSTRMGSPKQLVSIDDKYMLEHVIERVAWHPFEKIRVVIGHHAKTIQQSIQLTDPRIEWTVNQEYKKGQSTSFQLAFVNLPSSISSVMIFLGDQPFIKNNTISYIMKVGSNHRQRKSSPVVIRPTYKNQVGHPVFFKHYEKLDLSSVIGDSGGQKLMKSIKEKIYLPVSDAFITFDVDTPADYGRALSIVASGSKKRHVKDSNY
ncbi:NTP transferase domain-containing protein [Alkalihalobacillus sp. BA299]|uniref:nucleotidyltransferase family protein n=1 Tax=Alkalihalobacillus sp. BA299 TaxID=2815938 RepID=UPI001AD9DAD4|nr:nucleotidyltransferase family protein [Alkalihalobacillus sp. BA299]